jgi:hypothetical protein
MQSICSYGVCSSAFAAKVHDEFGPIRSLLLMVKWQECLKQIAFAPIGNQSAVYSAPRCMHSLTVVTRVIVTCFTLLNVPQISAAEPPLSIDEVAKILGYPAARLKVEDVTEQANRRSARKGKPGSITPRTTTLSPASQSS